MIGRCLYMSPSSATAFHLRPFPLLLPSQTQLLFAQSDYRRLWAIGGLTGVARWLEFVAIAIFAYELTRFSGARRPARRPAHGPLPAARVPDGSRGGYHRPQAPAGGDLRAMVAASGTMLVVTAMGAATYAAAAAIVMVSGAFWTTDMPVRRRLLVDAVKPQSVPAALGFDNATMYATRALGPLIGGATYQAVGISGIYALIAMSYLICLWLATRVRAPIRASSGEAPAARGKLGFLLPPQELVLDRRFQIIMGVTLVYNLWCWPFTGMVPVIGQKDFALTPALVGALSACDGLGGTFGALAVGAARNSSARSFASTSSARSRALCSSSDWHCI